MAKRNVVWTRTAELQFIGVVEYCAKKNKSDTYLKRLIAQVAKRTKQIAQTPLIYKSTDFKDIRVASLGNFSIYYKITDSQIIITAFWDGLAPIILEYYST